MAEVSNYSWLAQAFANLEDPEEDFFSVFGTPEQMDLYSAAITDDEILTAAWQFQQAGSHNSTDDLNLALGTTELMLNNPHGQPLPLERLLQIAEEYPAITVSGDLLSNDQTTITEAIELSNTDSFADNINTITSEADNQNIDLIGAAITPETSTFADRLAALAATLPSAKEGGEELFDEGAYISPMATSTFELDGEPVAGAFGTPDNMGLTYQEVLEGIKAEQDVNAAKAQEQAEKTLGGGEATAATTTNVLEAVRKAEMTGVKKGFNTLLDIYQTEGYNGFEEFVTDEQNYNLATGLTPEIVTDFIEDLYDPTSKYYPYVGDYGISSELIRDLNIEHQQFMQEWDPMGGFGIDPLWRPPVYETEESQARIYRDHENKLQELRETGGAFASETRGKTLAAATPLTNPTAVNWALVYKNNPQETLPVGANGVPLGNYDFVPPEGLSQDEKDYLNEQNNLIIQDKENRIGAAREDPMSGYIPTLTGQGTTSGLGYGQTISGPTGTGVDPITGQPMQQTTPTDTTPAGTIPAGTIPAGTTADGTGGTGAVETRIDPMTGLPAAPIGEGQTFGSFAGGTMSPEQFRQAAALATQQDATTYFTPEQQFMQSAMQATGPTSPLRQALYGAQNPLLQQYYLSGYGSLPQYGGNEEIRGFQDFIGDFSQGRRVGDDSLRSLAEQAARIGAMEDIDYAESLYDPAMSQQELNRRRLYRYTYGTGPQADENRQNLARFLSLQRPGGGVYGGVLGRALGSSVDEMAAAYAAMRPDAAQDFLSYYLQQSAGRNNPLMANSGQKPTAQD